MKAFDLLKTATGIRGYNLIGEELEFDYQNFQTEDEDDIILMGHNCTIFRDDLDKAIVKGKTIYIPKYYVLHLS